MKGHRWLAAAALFVGGTALAEIKLGITCVDADKGGAKVVKVSDPSLAKKIGLQPGDVILKVDNTRVDRVETLARHLAASESVSVIWQRGSKYYRGEVVNVKGTKWAELGGPESGVETTAEVAREGVKLRIDVVDSPGGVSVTSVRDGFGKVMGLQPGDVILWVNETRIDRVATIVNVLAVSEEASVIWVRGGKYYRGNVGLVIQVGEDGVPRYVREAKPAVEVDAAGKPKK